MDQNTQVDQNTQENQFIPKTEDNGADLFSELGNELDYGENNKFQHTVDSKRDPIEWIVFSLGLLFKILFVVCLVTGLDVTLRNLEKNETMKTLPLCSYYALGIVDYSNDTCAFYPEILSQQTTKLTELEKSLAENLVILVPQKLLLQSTLKKPEIQYILEKTSNSRIPIDEILTTFKKYRTSIGDYEGEDIDCRGYSVDEKGNLDVTCDFFGFSITSYGDSKVFTSRSTALAFLEKIRSPESWFKIKNEPKSLDIQTYSSADPGIRWTFTTMTTLNLNLQYASPIKN